MASYFGGYAFKSKSRAFEDEGERGRQPKPRFCAGLRLSAGIKDEPKEQVQHFLGKNVITFKLVPANDLFHGALSLLVIEFIDSFLPGIGFISTFKWTSPDIVC